MKLEEIYRKDINSILNDDGVEGVVKYVKRESYFTALFWAMFVFSVMILALCLTLIFF